MIRVTINSVRCKACGLCIAHCPKHLLGSAEAMNAAGYRPTVQDHPEQCNGCAICALMCPEICFTIARVPDQPGDGAEEVAK